MFSRWFRSSPSPFQTALAMVGVKAGDRLLVAGAGQPDLAAELACVTGLNGSAVVVDPAADARPRVDTAAETAGALIEFVSAPLSTVPREAGSFDLAIVPALGLTSGADRLPALKEVFRLLRPGGRLVVIDGAIRRASLGRVQHDAATFPPDEILSLLDAAGGQAVRLLATSDRISYFEARRQSPPSVQSAGSTATSEDV